MRFVFEARVVDGDNGNPAAGTDATTLRIGIEEGELPAETTEYPIEDGQFEAVLEFRSFSSLTRIRVEIEGPTTELFTAPPLFVPSASGGIMRVVTAAPSSCTPVSFNAMEAPRARFGMVQSGTFALVVGGTTASDEQVEFFDALEWESRLFTEELSLSDLGETRAASIDGAEILVLPADAGPFIFNMLNASDRITQVVLHVGAGPQSALVSVPGLGAMVIGGEAAGEAQSAVSLVEPGGEVTSLQLSEPRSGPAATALGSDVLVVGGNEAGNAELLRFGVPVGQPVTSVMDGVREDSLLVGDGESRALWMGGTDESGTIRLDTVAFQDCPSSCASSEGPPWATARLDGTQPAGSTLIIGGDNSSSVEEVTWPGGGAEIGSVLSLNTPRASAGAIVYESGAFVVAGGSDDMGARDDFEFCVPAALEPL